MGIIVSVCGGGNETFDLYQCELRHKKALDNYNKKLACYNCYYHGDFNSYIYQLQAEYEYECMEPIVLQGSYVNHSVSRFDNF